MTNIKRGGKVKVLATGAIETVIRVDEAQVITLGSSMRNNWYHPSKVVAL